jgi:hypothetical protein
MTTDTMIELPYYYYINASIEHWNIEKWGRIEETRHTEVTRKEDLVDGTVLFELETESYDRFDDVKDNDTFAPLLAPELGATKEAFERQFSFTQHDKN